MSSSEGKDHSSRHTLNLSGTKELPRVRLLFLDSNEENVPFRVVWRPYLASDPSVLALCPPLAPLNPDLVGPSSAISTMTRGDAHHLQGVYGILDDIQVLAHNLNERVTL